MNKKITRLYLSLLVFLLSFFAIYSQRFVVYDYLNTHYEYSDTLSKEKIKVTFYITKDFQESNKEQINNIIENGNKVEEQVNKESNVINCDSIEIAQIKNRINATDSNFITIVIKNSKDTINKINSIIYSAKSMGYTIENL